MAMARKTPTRSRNGRAKNAPASPKASAALGTAAPPDAAHAAFSASLMPLHGMLRFMAQWREAQAALLHDIDESLSANLNAPDKPADFQELMHLQGGLATAQWGRAANAASALFRSWLETEAALLEQMQAQGLASTRQLLDDAPNTAPSRGSAAQQGGGVRRSMR